MLREITWAQLQEWLAYMEMEPWDERRMDWRFAYLCAIVSNIVRGRNDPARKVEEFLIPFGEDAQRRPAGVRPWQEVFAIGRAWASLANAVAAAEAEGRMAEGG